MLDGSVEMNKTFIGDKGNKHFDKKGKADKSVVLGALEHQREIVTKMIFNRSLLNIKAFVKNHILAGY